MLSPRRFRVYSDSIYTFGYVANGFAFIMKPLKNSPSYWRYLCALHFVHFFIFSDLMFGLAYIRMGDW